MKNLVGLLIILFMISSCKKEEILLPSEVPLGSLELTGNFTDLTTSGFVKSCEELTELIVDKELKGMGAEERSVTFKSDGSIIDTNGHLSSWNYARWENEDGSVQYFCNLFQVGYNVTEQKNLFNLVKVTDYYIHFKIQIENVSQDSDLFLEY